MRAFISSTYRDLIDHRRAVADTLGRLGHQLQRMETFGARPEDATQACLAEIDASELFVGTYAKRYGYVPRDSEISITEAEFDFAFKLRRPTFCFFVDEEYPWPHELVDPEPAASHLGKIQGPCRSACGADYFPTPTGCLYGIDNIRISNRLDLTRRSARQVLDVAPLPTIHKEVSDGDMV
jgi:hypothetical protein